MKKLSLYITLALVSLVLGACSDEYEPWGNPQTYPEENAITIPGMKANAVATQDLGTVGEQVPLFTLTTAELPEGYTLQNARVGLLPENINGQFDGATPTIINTTLDGKASTEEVQALVEKYYGKRPEARKFVAYVYVNAVKDGQAALIDAGTINVVVIPKGLQFTEFLYMAGDANSWKHSDILHGPAFDGKYLGYMYLNQKGFKFCTQPNWDGTNYGKDFSTAGDAANIMMTEPDGFYKVEVDLQAFSYKLTPITSIGIIGDATGSWDNDIAMTYEADSHEWIAKSVTLKDGEMKFRANGAWDISWGGTDLTKLTSNNGANIKVNAGTYTIKLKPSYDDNTKAELIKE